MAVRCTPIQTRKLDDLTAWVRHPDKGLEGPMPIREALARMLDLKAEYKHREWKPLVVIDPKDAEEFGR